jgi:hypothetical protein
MLSFIPQEPFPTSKHPPKSDQDKADLQAFFGPNGAAYPSASIEKLAKLAQTLKSSGVKHVGAYGFCWGTDRDRFVFVYPHVFVGAKICILAGGDNTPLDAVAMVHPACVLLSLDMSTHDLNLFQYAFF